jgi:hypothetical protein
VTGIRFYKGALNTGTHVGHLWTTNGFMLGDATFTGETASGWQQVDFASPVQINANATYIASYHTDVGFYALDRPYFGTAYDNGVLHALRDGQDGPNGVFAIGGIGFPALTNGSANYWVDVLFTTTAP